MTKTLDDVFAQLERLTRVVEGLEARLPSPLVTVAQAAVALGVSEITIRRMVKRGRLRSFRIGRAVRVDVSRSIPKRRK